MNLQTLRTSLDSAKTGYFEQTFFDYGDVLNTLGEKKYPYVLWDIANSTGITKLRESYKELELNVIGAQKFNPDSDNLLIGWDALEVLLKSYLLAIAALSYISISNVTSEVEYYQRGIISIDGEIAVRMRIKLILFC